MYFMGGGILVRDFKHYISSLRHYISSSKDVRGRGFAEEGCSLRKGVCRGREFRLPQQTGTRQPSQR